MQISIKYERTYDCIYRKGHFSNGFQIILRKCGSWDPIKYVKYAGPREWELDNTYPKSPEGLRSDKKQQEVHSG